MPAVIKTSVHLFNSEQIIVLYCITNWCHGHKTILIKIQKISDKFIKIMQEKSKNHDTNECGKFLSIGLQQMFIKDVVNFAFKHKTNYYPRHLITF